MGGLSAPKSHGSRYIHVTFRPSHLPNSSIKGRWCPRIFKRTRSPLSLGFLCANVALIPIRSKPRSSRKRNAARCDCGTLTADKLKAQK
ncbi:MAG: hypothetical protein CFE48_04510 [Pseudomonas sp. PGPPP2]|nr:MAG: hypothetical protein CFE48_04510 [Pseudomonas sp. PGPPP2]